MGIMKGKDWRSADCACACSVTMYNEVIEANIS